MAWRRRRGGLPVHEEIVFGEFGVELEKLL
jgi:hypothetical protein